MTKEKIVQKITAFGPIIIALIGIINMFLEAQGLPCLEIADTDITNLVSAVAAVVGSILATWYNCPVTQNAKMSQEVLNGLKDGSVTSQQVESILPEQVVVK